MDSLTSPITPPPVRVTAIVAGGKSQLGWPSDVSLNFTGTTPRLTLKMLELSALISDPSFLPT
jgi:hypothetical protein